MDAEMQVDAEDAIAFLADRAAIEQIAQRFVIKYAPAINGAPTELARGRAWIALHHYLVAGATRRKPWGLTNDQAEAVINALTPLL
jgi:hypothetical protein